MCLNMTDQSSYEAQSAIDALKKTINNIMYQTIIRISVLIRTQSITNDITTTQLVAFINKRIYVIA